MMENARLSESNFDLRAQIFLIGNKHVSWFALTWQLNSFI